VRAKPALCLADFEEADLRGLIANAFHAVQLIGILGVVIKDRDE
jgi:hypothetical protein